MLVVCGEALIDVFVQGDTPDGLAVEARVGGSPFNVAVGLARLAQPVAFVGAVSRDASGERLMRALAAEGVQTGWVQRHNARSTVSFVGVDPQGVATYAFYGDGGADRRLGAAVLDRLPDPVQAIHVGSYATVVEPIAHTLQALVQRHQGRCVIAYDPNVRLNVEPDIERWLDQLDFMLPRTQVLKVSEEDLQRLYRQPSVESFASRALASGVALLVVTRGAAGASAWVQGQPRLDVPAVDAEVVDTVGAGDAFQAALLARLAELGRLSLEGLRSLDVDQARDALGFAARAAALACARRGADLPRRPELPAHGLH
jgi:fructokinase